MTKMIMLVIGAIIMTMSQALIQSVSREHHVECQNFQNLSPGNRFHMKAYGSYPARTNCLFWDKDTIIWFHSLLDNKCVADLSFNVCVGRVPKIGVGVLTKFYFSDFSESLILSTRV